MLLHDIVLCWAFLFFILAIAALIVVFTRANNSRRTEAAPKAVFDFSAGQAEGRQMQTVLMAALAGSTTDAEFEQSFRAAAQLATRLDAETSWAWLGRFLMEYRKANEFEASPRALAERFLADIPRRYNLPEVSPEPVQRDA